ncbi:hypothetical protein MMC07_002264 [Pseudocyphellaria aurata]|nr:hypothetical protein [Pseudocyphellaria aurata]
MLEHDPVISEYEHEKFRPREAEALQTLRKVASLVKPIMRQRGWKVGILTEFWPPEKNLLGLNWNKGQKICLRLRYPYDERQFIPVEQVVDTMLHELCHIVHGPHDEPFHTLWNQLRNEHEQLVRKGYTGEGFLSTGHKLGGGRIPRHEAQRRARAAAEKRRTLTAGSGQKLGGASVGRGQDIRRVIADAATQRLNAAKGCASGTERGRGIVEETTKNGTRTKADEEDADGEAIMLAYIDLIQEEEKEIYGDSYVPASKENPAGSQGALVGRSAAQTVPKPPPIPTSTKPAPPGPVVDLTSNPPNPNAGSWPCDICTLVNPDTYLCCDACGTERGGSTFASSPPPPAPPLRSSYPSSSTSTSSKKPTPTPTHQNNNNYNSRGPRPTPDKNKKAGSIQTLIALDKTARAQAQDQPLGWLCHRCGNFTEIEWWTCARCGVRRLPSS